MLSYKFSSSVFLRSPACSYETFDTGKLQQVLNSPFFRLALYFASRGLYMQVQLKGFDVDSMGRGMLESLLKYFNRICYRVTPFGIFSAFSLVRWGADTGGLTIHKKERVHLLADFEFMEKIAAGIHAAKPSDVLYPDPGIYQAGKELRYLRKWKDDNDHPDTGITGVESSRLLKKIIHKAREGISREELRQFLKQYYEDEDAGELISELEAEKLLINQALLNITGENYLRRIGKQYGEIKITEFARSLNDTAHITVGSLVHLLKPFTGNFEQLKSPFYVNYERKLSGCIDEHFQEVLRSGLFALSKLQTPAVNGSLERFKENFLSAYDGREVQLMTALDPEYGIGYEQREDIPEKDEILRGIVFHDHAAAKQIPWGPVQELLMNRIMNCSKGESIILTDHELERLPGIKEKQLPPGMSVIFRMAGEQLLIEDAGGVCATSLTGRFTAVSDEVLEHAVKLAEDEQEANPDIIFAEIAAYSADTHAANINTRRHIRQYEIPVMVHSTLPREQMILLNDLYVSVHQNELILRSLSLNKRVIPRLSSAYNYARSELPVFRFLCDLQYQGLAADLTLRPEKLLPGLSHCPRIEYKNCILQEAFWVLKARDIKEMKGIAAFLKFAEQQHISRYFAISQSDRQLVFDLEDPGSIRMFLEETVKAGDLVLKEFFVPPAGNALLKDREGRGYIHQMIATLTRTVKSYFPVPLHQAAPVRTTRYFFPGDEWIYFKIYCAPQYGSEIISRRIYPLMKKCRSRPGFGKWFFVRYYDPEPHLRLRIQANPVLLETMPGLVNQALKPFLKSGSIRRLQIDTYIREIERYGADTIEQAETVFMSSSELVAEYMRKEINEEEMIPFAVRSIHEIFDSYSLGLDEKIGILEQVCRKLISEWDHEKQLKADLDKKYREHQHKIAGFISGENLFSASSERALLKKLTRDIVLLSQCFDGSGRSRVTRSVSDILHMHMNRIFSAGQRRKEFVIYYLCLRFYISFRARRVDGAGYSLPGRSPGVDPGPPD